MQKVLEVSCSAICIYNPFLQSSVLIKGPLAAFNNGKLLESGLTVSAHFLISNSRDTDLNLTYRSPLSLLSFFILFFCNGEVVCCDCGQESVVLTL